MARGTRYNGATRLPEGIENVRAADRARMRARRRTAAHYRQEYLALLAEYRAAGDTGTARTPSGHIFAAYREVCRRHPNTYRRCLAAERAKERIVLLPIGSRSVHPHGTAVAYKRHQVHQEAPCTSCQAWYDKHHRKPCALCGRPFDWTGNQNYCGEDCHRIAHWLRYWRLKANRKRRATGPFEGTMVREAAQRAGLDLDELAARWIRDPERSA